MMFEFYTFKNWDPKQKSSILFLNKILSIMTIVCISPMTKLNVCKMIHKVTMYNEKKDEAIIFL